MSLKTNKQKSEHKNCERKKVKKTSKKSHAEREKKNQKSNNKKVQSLPFPYSKRSLIRSNKKLEHLGSHHEICIKKKL